ncbi:MAG: GldG family protein [Candidatus Aureabacteria bacterium]|nr:GldG family protein [Candidatus Auribacterota bacterium]
MIKVVTSLLYLSCLFLFITAANVISGRHYIKWDTTASGLFTLSHKSEVIVNDLKVPVEIYIYFKPEHELTPMLKNLLMVYEAASDKIKVNWIDPYRDFEKINELGEIGKQFKINTVLLRNKMRHRFLTVYDLGDYDRRFEEMGISPKLKGFNGEAAISGAIIGLSDADPPLIGIIINHGERNPNESGDEGISSFVRSLILQGFQFTLINCDNLPSIPEKINILISCRPRIAFSNEELFMIEKWMKKNNGGLFLALDPLIHHNDMTMMRFNLDSFLDAYGIGLENTIVVDPSKQIPYSRPDTLYIDLYSDSDIMQNLHNIPTLFFQARSLTAHAIKEGVVVPLCATSDKAWGEVQYSNSEYVFDKDHDKKGPNYIGVAAESSGGKGKLVVFGDSDFMSNQLFSNLGNAKLLENSFFWLIDKTSLLQIQSKDSKPVSLALGRIQLIGIFILGVCGLPFLVIILGVFVWKKRYAYFR